MSEDDYVTVRIPKQLADEVDEIIRSGHSDIGLELK